MLVKRLAIDEHQPPVNVIASLIQKMGTLGELVLQGEPDQQHCYQPAFFQTEHNLAQQLRQLLIRPSTIDFFGYLNIYSFCNLMAIVFSNET